MADDNEPEAVHVSQLPREVLLHVFSMLSGADLRGSVAPTCREWRELSRDPLLWTKLRLDGAAVSTEDACDLIGSCPLWSLELLDRRDAERLLEAVVLARRSLRVLAVRRCWGKQETTAVRGDLLLGVAATSPHMRHLTVKDTCVDWHRDGDHFFREMVSCLPQLRSVNFNHGWCETSDDFLAALVAACPCLRDVRVVTRTCTQPLTMNKSPGADDVAAMCAALSDTLVVLKLNASLLGDDGMLALSRCHRLSVLHLHHALLLTARGLTHVACLPRLASLNLTLVYTVSALQWADFFAQPNSRQLSSIALVICAHIDDNVLQAIADNCFALRSLRLTGCRRVTDDGLLSILRCCTSLRRLSIVFSTIDLVSIWPLIPQYCPSLQQLVYQPNDGWQKHC